MTVTIYHNNRCSNSRGALALIRGAGIEPTIIDYIAEPLSRDGLAKLVKKLGGSPRDILRSKEAIYSELKLEKATDDALLDAMAAHPTLINRPIVVTDKGAKLCRPPELVKDLL
jgi:arsenate reductase